MLRTHLLAPILLVATAAPVAAAAWALAGRIVHATLGRLALAWFLGVAQATVTLQVLGMVGAWSPVPLVAAAWAGAAAVWGIARTVPDVAPGSGDEPESGREAGDDVAVWIRWLTVAAPLALGLAALAAALFQPDTANDSMMYHRPMLAAWLHGGTFWRIPSLENGPSYEGGYWSNGDLFSLWAAILYGRDWLVQTTSLIWYPGVWLATAAAARTLGLGRWSAALVASGICCCFGVAGGQMAMMHVDLYTAMCVSVMVWASLRWWCHNGAGRPTTWLAIAGLAAGAAVGSKQFALPFCSVWVVVVAVAALRRRQWAGAAVLVATTAVLSLAWPVRALVVTGSPLWPISAGPFAGPAVVLPDGARSVLGLARSVGPAPVLVEMMLSFVLGYSLFGLQLLVRLRQVWRWTGERRLRILGLGVPAFGYLAYLVSPGTGQFSGQILITTRVFSAAAITAIVVLGAATLGAGAADAASDADQAAATATGPDADAASAESVTSRAVRRARIWFGVSVLWGYGVTLTFHSISSFGWAWWARLGGLAAAGVVATLAVNGTLAGAARHRLVATVAAGLSVLCIAVAAPAKAANWYPYQRNLAYLAPVLDWLRRDDVHGARIAYAGIYSAPLLGRDLTNTVYWLGRPAPHDGMTVWTDQREWEQALLAACTDYVVIGTDAAKRASTSLDQPMYAGWGRPLPEWVWAKTSPILQPVAGAQTSEVAVYKVTGPHPASCTDPGPGRNRRPA